MLVKMPIYIMLLLIASVCFADVVPLTTEKAIPFFTFINNLDWLQHEIWLNSLLGFGLALTVIVVLMMFSNALYLFRKKEVFELEFTHYRLYSSFGILLFILSTWFLIYSFFPVDELPATVNALASLLPKALNVTLFILLFLLGMPALIYEIILTAKIFHNSSCAYMRMFYFIFLLIVGLLLIYYVAVAMSGLFNAFPIYSYLLFFTGIIPLIFSIDIFLHLKRIDEISDGFKKGMAVINSFAVVFLLLYVFGFSVFAGVIAFLLQLYLFVELVKAIPLQKMHASVLLSYSFYDVILLLYTVVIIHQLTIPLMFV